MERLVPSNARIFNLRLQVFIYTIIIHIPTNCAYDIVTDDHSAGTFNTSVNHFHGKHLENCVTFAYFNLPRNIRSRLTVSNVMKLL